MYCRHCGTENPDTAAFCKRCGASLGEGRGPVPTTRSPTAAPAWWFLLGVLGLLAAVYLLVDFLLNARLLVFAISTAATALLMGLIYLLLFAAVEAYRKPVVLVASVLLIVASAASLPFLLGGLVGPFVPGSDQVTYSMAPAPEAASLELSVHNTVGSIRLTSVETEAFLVFAWVNLSGWGDLEEGMADIQWSTEVTEGRAEADLVLPRVPQFLGGIVFDVDVHVQADLPFNVTLETTTGSLAGSLGPGARVGVLRMTTTTGSVELDVEGPALSPFSSLLLETTTGSVDAAIALPTGPVGTVPLTARTTTGSVDLALTLGATVGAEGSASTTTGSVSLDSTKYMGTASSFETPNLSSAVTVLQVTLRTTTGSVDVR